MVKNETNFYYNTPVYILVPQESYILVPWPVYSHLSVQNGTASWLVVDLQHRHMYNR